MESLLNMRIQKAVPQIKVMITQFYTEESCPQYYRTVCVSFSKQQKTQSLTLKTIKPRSLPSTSTMQTLTWKVSLKKQSLTFVQSFSSSTDLKLFDFN